jgi:hypothetical protein
MMDDFQISDFAADDLIDADNDGTDDTVAIDTEPVGVDDDGTPEGIFTDTTGDGIIDTGIIDTDGDGIADVFAADRDQDGTLDEIVLDADRNGFFDNVAPPGAHGAGGAVEAPIELVGPTPAPTSASGPVAPVSPGGATPTGPADVGEPPSTAAPAPSNATAPTATTEGGPQPIDLTPTTTEPTPRAEEPERPGESRRPSVADIRRNPGARDEDREPATGPAPTTDPADGEV